MIYLKEWIKILSNTLSNSIDDADARKDARKLKQILISEDEWELLTELTEVLSIFEEATTELGGSKYITNSLRVRMLVEITKILRTSLPDNQFDENEDAFDDIEEEDDSINRPLNTYSLLDEVKLKLYTNLIKYYPSIFTEVLIPSILDPRFKSLDFASSNQKLNTEQHLQKLYEEEKQKQREISNTSSTSGTSGTSDTSGTSGLKKRKTLMERLTKNSTIAINEVGEYLNLYEIPLNSDPLIWWNEKKSKFPILSNLARKYLAVSATSTASERLFSDAGNLLTNKRTRMKPTLFKKIMFLKRNSSKLESIYPAN